MYCWTSQQRRPFRPPPQDVWVETLPDNSVAL